MTKNSDALRDLQVTVNPIRKIWEIDVKRMLDIKPFGSVECWWRSEVVNFIFKLDAGMIEKQSDRLSILTKRKQIITMKLILISRTTYSSNIPIAENRCSHD